jgi:hypothetical protein
VVLGLILLAFRLALPVVVAPLVAAQLSRVLGGRVAVGNVSFQPIDAIFTLHDVAVSARARPGSPANSTPAIVAEHVRVDVQWLPLLHRTVRVRELLLESARVAVDRFPDGGFGLADLERADPAAALPTGWSFALDRIGFRDVQLRVHDLAAGEGAFVDVAVRSADVSGLQRRATVFGKAPNLHVVALVGGGQLDVRGRYDWRDDGIALDAQLWVKGVPLAHARSYVAALGWTDLSGEVFGQLRWLREPRRRDVLSGRLVLRGGSIQVADLSEPALAVRRGIADIKAIDLLHRRVVIGSLTLRGATLALRPDADAPVPLLAATTSPPASSDARSPVAPPGRVQSATRWGWMIERFDATNSHVRVLARSGHFDLRARAAGENFGRGAYWSPLRIDVARDAIAAAFDGTARVADGLTIEGRLIVGGIDFPSMARAARFPWADWVQTGQATADLTVQLEAAAVDAPPFYAQGTISLTDLWVAGPDPGTLGFGAAGIVLTLEGLAGSTAGRGSSRDDHPTRIEFSRADVSTPSVFLLRTSDGWLVPPLTPAVEQPAGEMPEIVIGKLSSVGGSLVVVDLVPEPAMVFDLTPLGGSARNVVLPGLTFDGLQLRGSDRAFGTLQVGGSRRSDTTEFEFSGEGVPLAAITPYLDLAQLPYHFASGIGALSVHGSFDPARWNADVALALRAPVFIDPDASLEQALGMPVASALARLRDQSGDVALQVALASSGGDGPGSYKEQVAAGVRETMRRVAQAAAERAATASATVLFQPGQVEPTPAALRQLDPVLQLLTTHPDLVMTLTPETSARDRRWLAEQALAATLDDRGGVATVLRALGVRTARERIRTALAARAHGAPGELDEEDEAELARMVAEGPPLDNARLAELRTARLTRVLRYLADHHRVSSGRVVVRNVASAQDATAAVVRAQLMMGAKTSAEPPASVRGAEGTIGSPEAGSARAK